MVNPVQRCTIGKNFVQMYQCIVHAHFYNYYYYIKLVIRTKKPLPNQKVTVSSDTDDLKTWKSTGTSCQIEIHFCNPNYKIKRYKGLKTAKWISIW
jgi:hypothetical protein